MPHHRSAFFISDRTGITAEILGHSLLSQFDSVEFNRVTLPFVDTQEKAQSARDRINAASRDEGRRALEALGVDPNEIRFQTKCLRYLGMAALATKEHQPLTNPP